jgi:general secretion pathway protein G
MRSLTTRKSGFTLVEILIVVIILGILAAIVIPQFTNASEDARQSSAASQLQTIRSAVELYKLQHGDKYPLDTAGTGWDWTKLTGTSTGTDGTTVGPYLQQVPVNPLNGDSKVLCQPNDPVAATPTQAAGDEGYIFSQNTGKFFATDDANKSDLAY